MAHSEPTKAFSKCRLETAMLSAPDWDKCKFKSNFFTQGNDTLYNPMEIVEVFNDFFHSTFNRPNHQQPLSDITQLSPPSQQLRLPDQRLMKS